MKIAFIIVPKRRCCQHASTVHRTELRSCASRHLHLPVPSKKDTGRIYHTFGCIVSVLACGTGPPGHNHSTAVRPRKAPMTTTASRLRMTNSQAAMSMTSYYRERRAPWARRSPHQGPSPSWASLACVLVQPMKIRKTYLSLPLISLK
jgi:hypothetical protein